jgi:predicted NBD/HSP70 family sugar kinase
MKNEYISHTTTSNEEYYVIGFDKKEFIAKITDIQRHHKEYPNPTDVDVKQIPSLDDRQRVLQIIEKELSKNDE